MRPVKSNDRVFVKNTTNVGVCYFLVAGAKLIQRASIWRTNLGTRRAAVAYHATRPRLSEGYDSTYQNIEECEISEIYFRYIPTESAINEVILPLLRMFVPFFGKHLTFDRMGFNGYPV